ncbi:4963_t:CDS:10, partial [Acaulospora colombiana]
MSSDPLVQFVTFSSAVEASFWHSLSTRKIDLYKLDDAPKKIIGYYSTGRSLQSQDSTEASIAVPARLCLGTGAFPEVNDDSISSLPVFSFPSVGTIKNTNTIEEFKQLDKNALFKEATEQDITSGAAVNLPYLLTRFILVTFADLKKYKYHFWFGFPALLTEPPWMVGGDGQVKGVDSVWNEKEIESLRNNYESFTQRHSSMCAGFFLVKKSDYEIEVGRLSEWDTFFKDCDDSEDSPTLQVCLTILDGLCEIFWCLYNVSGMFAGSKYYVIEKSQEKKTFRKVSVGWEKNSQGKLGPRVADLSHLMDPKRLADTSVDLNLKLMRWRIVPELDLEKIKDTRCLLLGAGTLGCYVARCLLGWGVRHITFVDNSCVSFSNPVRQPLFFFVDCLDGGKPKAQTAAENLKKVYPGVVSEGHELTIPMPGHPISSETRTRSDVEKLVQLFESHDVIFLLLDSRESRWLPTLLGSVMRKLVINIALGFDTYVVMRHGVKDDSESQVASSSNIKIPLVKKLGCYFCNDVVAPVNSLKDRTLDQQCTVTRPGLSAIAAALGVELMVSVLHHDKGPAAPADTGIEPSGSTDSSTSSPLGIIPHQMRGFLNHFNNMIVVGQAYDRCTACSEFIIDEYQTRGFEFLERAFNSPTYLEEITGLTKLHQESENVDDFVWDDDENT